MRTLWCLVSLVTIVAAQPRAELDWWQTAVFYQIYPRSFRDSDGDGIGDLKGITEKLEHLKDIGVGGVWLSPIFKSPMADFGYDISDFQNIDAMFGTMEDFDNLLEKAKEFDIKVILDFVPNHSSDEHEWFVKSAQNDVDYSDFYVWHDGKVLTNGTRVRPNNWQSVFGGPAWTFHGGRQQYYLHQFDPKQPDLNYSNPLVVEAMKDVLRFWLDKGVDGFRVDAVPHLFEGPIDVDDSVTSAPQHRPETYEMVVQWRKIMDEKSVQYGGTKVLMLEAYGSVDDIMGYYGTPSAPGGHFPFNFRLISDIDKSSSAEDFSTVINEYLEHMTDGRTANWVLGNHDKHRVASRFVPELVDGLNFLAHLLPGIGVTYNGEEIGMENTFITWEQCRDPQGINAGPEHYLEATRDLERTPFQWDSSTSAGFSSSESTWLPVNPNYVELNLEAQKAAEKSHYKVYKQLTELRKNPTIQRGGAHVAALSQNVLGFTRTLPDEDTYVVVINLGDEMEVVDVKKALSEVPDKIKIHILGINSRHMAGHTLSSSSLEIQPKEAFVFIDPGNSVSMILPSSLFVLIVQFVIRYV
ncbi:Maltase 2 [Cryptotermes secundus]|uniref:alpha-glucosidase n=1 Tax=Cryptotermes secundus TaxID=105785 RepID=A0A2J7PZ48_9NEOP|nr:maltase 2 [Cryptotermes secundus]PNF21613.1 Maltase 2 [Cryptotermes secundus]